MSRNIISGLKFRKQPEGFNAIELGDMLEAAYMQQKRPDKHTQKKTFSPSTIGYGHGTCPRYWFLAFTGAPFVESVDALGIANMANGTQAHERIEKLFDDSGIRLGNEIEITMVDPPIRGYADVEIDWKGEPVIGEIKTTRQEAFLVREASGKPSANHLFQILIYMRARKRKLGFLLYENKNSQEFLVIPIEMTDKNAEILDNALDWMRTVYKTYEDQSAPVRPWKKQVKVCQGCPVKDWCWSDESPEGIEEIPRMEVPTL